MEELLKIDKEYLEELINYIGRSLTGKCMKRFEILDDNNMIKSDIRELIYEEIRHFRDLLIAHDKGLNIQQFHFKVKEGESSV